MIISFSSFFKDNLPFFQFRIGHDNSGSDPDWLLKRVDIYIARLDQTWTFSCEKWSSEFKNEYQLEVNYTSNV